MSNNPKWKLPFSGVSNSLTATGTNQATALALTKEINELTTVGSGTGVILPVIFSSKEGIGITIINLGANALSIYPATGQSINALSANTAYSLPANSTILLYANNSTSWTTFNYYDILNSPTETSFDASNDFLAMYKASSGKVSKITSTNLPIGITNLTGETSINLAADELVIYDASAGANRKVIPNEILNERSVSTQNSLTGGGNLGADRTLNLVNDTASPGNLKVYGTDSGGTRGWQSGTTLIDYFGAFKNKIINGNFLVWQSGTSFASITTGSFFADRWIYSKVGTMVHDVTQSADAPTVAQAGTKIINSALIDCTTADSSIAAGDLCAIKTKIEGYNALPLMERAFTLTFWVKATKTGIYCVAFSNSGSDRSYVSEYTVNVTDTWELKTVTVSASPSAGTWSYTTGVGLEVRFALAAGSTFQTTADAWQTGNFYATANQVNGCDSNSNNFRIVLVQVEPGSNASSFEMRDITTETLMCQRYYNRVVNGSGGAVYLSTLQAFNTGSVFGKILDFSVRMRTTPTVAYSALADLSLYTTGATGAVVTGTPSLLPSVDGLTTGQLDRTGSGLTAGNAVILSLANGGYLAFSAEL